MEQVSNQLSLWDQIQETVVSIRSKITVTPSVGVILGTGLGGFGSQIEDAQEIDYEQIPHFPRTTVEGHGGQLVFGKVGDKSIADLTKFSIRDAAGFFGLLELTERERLIGQRILKEICAINNELLRRR